MQHDDAKDPAFGQNWPQIHGAAYQQATAAAPHVRARRVDGAVRYACPVNNSVVLVTDPATLTSLKPPLARMRCLSCGELHLLDLGEARPAA